MEATDELYRKSEGIIDLCVGNVAKARPYLDRDELKSLANTVFMDAARDFDPSKGSSFTTYLYNRLKCLNDESDRVLVPDGHGGRTMAENVDDYLGSNGFVVNLNPEVIVPASIEYTERMADDGHSELFAHCDKVLSPEGMDVVKAIDESSLDPKKPVNFGVRNARYAKRCVLNAKSMWLRRYRNMGWTMNQCERTLKEVRSIVKQYSRGGLPCRLVRA